MKLTPHYCPKHRTSTPAIVSAELIAEGRPGCIACAAEERLERVGHRADVDGDAEQCKFALDGKQKKMVKKYRRGKRKQGSLSKRNQNKPCD